MSQLDFKTEEPFESLLGDAPPSSQDNSALSSVDPATGSPRTDSRFCSLTSSQVRSLSPVYSSRKHASSLITAKLLDSVVHFKFEVELAPQILHGDKERKVSHEYEVLVDVVAGPCFGEQLVFSDLAVERLRAERQAGTQVESQVESLTESRERYLVQGQLNLTRLIERHESGILAAESAGATDLQLRYCLLGRAEQHRFVSDTFFFSVPARNSWFDAAGWIAYPHDAAVTASSNAAGAAVAGSSVLIEGWALRQGDKLARVEIYLDEHLVGGARVGLPIDCTLDPFIGGDFARGAMAANEQVHPPVPLRGLPPLCAEVKHSRFSFWIQRAELAQRVGGEDVLTQGCWVKAKCYFESGVQLWVDGYALRLLPGQDVPIGAIETVRELLDGGIEVSGYFAAADLSPWNFFLEGRSWRRQLIVGKELFWSRYPSIEMMHPLLDRDRPTGFSVRIAKALLGASPGIIKLVGQSADGRERLEIGPRSAWINISDRIFNGREAEPFLSRISARFSRFLSAVGMRNEFPLSTMQQKKRDVRGVGPGGAAQDCLPLPATLLVAVARLDKFTGEAKQLEQMLSALLAKGVKPEGLLVVSAKDGALKQTLGRLGVAVEVLPQVDTQEQSWERYHRSLTLLDQLLKEREFQPEFVLCAGADCFWGADYAVRCLLPSSMYLKGGVAPYEWFTELEPRLRKLFLHRIGQIDLLFASEAERLNYYRFIAPNRSTVIPKAVGVPAESNHAVSSDGAASFDDLRARLGCGDRFVVTAIGVGSSQAGVEFLLSELARLRRERVDLAFSAVLIGEYEQSYLEALKDLILFEKLESVVTFVAAQADLAPYYAISDLVVVTSTVESSSFVVLEAFAHGCPVASTVGFGQSGQLEAGVNAMRISHLEPGSLSAVVAELYNRPELLAQLRSGGLRTLEDYPLEEYLSAFSEAISKTWVRGFGSGS